MALEVVDPLTLEGWPFEIGGHSGNRVAKINGNAGEGESRSAITLPGPVTVDARFETWFCTGNGPDFDPDNTLLNGNAGHLELVLNDSQDSGSGIHDHYDGRRAMIYFESQGWINWETGTFDSSPRFCGSFTGDCGVRL